MYVNYGRREDFQALAQLGLDLTGKIAVARYGKIFRGLKAMIGQMYGIAGLIIYSDPADDGFASPAARNEVKSRLSSFLSFLFFPSYAAPVSCRSCVLRA